MAPDTERLSCASCGARVAVRLKVGRHCGDCESKSAWDEQAKAGTPLVVSKEDIARAEALAIGEAGGASIARRVVPLLSAALAAALAAMNGYLVVRLLGARPLGRLLDLVEEVQRTSVAAIGLGVAAFIVGVVATRRLKRSRHYRAWWATGAAALGIFAGIAGATSGGFAAVSAFRGSGWKYLAMPPLDLAETSTPFVAAIKRATVVIVAPDADGDANGRVIGTGTVIRSERDRAWIATCSHVAMPYAAVASFRDATKAHAVWVYLADGRDGPARVDWVAQPPLDVAVIRFEVKDPPAAVPVIDGGEEIRESEGVVFIPNPMRHGWLVHHGSVSRREPHTTPAGRYSLIYTDLPAKPGDSGSGLFDSQGRLVGITTWGLYGGDGPAGICLPSETMQGILARLGVVGVVESAPTAASRR